MKAKHLFTLLLALMLGACSADAPTSTPTPCSADGLTGNLRSLEGKFATLCWVAYAPTRYDPTQEEHLLSPNEMKTSIREDLHVLRNAGFQGLVTYSALEPCDQIPRLAREAGFEGIVVGVWDPTDQWELEQAARLAALVDGYVVGNEGLYFGRYEFKDLAVAIDTLRQQTCRPVATTEVLPEYHSGSALLSLGDWIFPNVHPYWAGHTESSWAAHWTAAQFERLRRLTYKPLIFKEVELPTSGAPGLSEEDQAEFFDLLQQTGVRFVYFEGYDVPWKNESAVEPHWGVFNSDRTPKPAAGIVCGRESSSILEPLPTAAPGEPVTLPLVVYKEGGDTAVSFHPTGWMGDVPDLSLDPTHTIAPHSGQTCIRLSYDPEGMQGWAGIYWQAPEGNWGDQPGGYDLESANTLSFWARGARGSEVVEFGVGGIAGEYRDSLWPARTTGPQRLSTEWREYHIDLQDADLHHIVGGFYVVFSAFQVAEEKTTIYLDDIRYVP
jgi:exo-beta-1,3-glucanase (GH17 family)